MISFFFFSTKENLKNYATPLKPDATCISGNSWNEWKINEKKNKRFFDWDSINDSIEYSLAGLNQFHLPYYQNCSTSISVRLFKLWALLLRGGSCNVFCCSLNLNIWKLSMKPLTIKTFNWFYCDTNSTEKKPAKCSNNWWKIVISALYD